MTGIESNETRTKVQALAKERKVDTVLLEPTLGRVWRFDQKGNIVAEGGAFEIEKDLSDRYVSCLGPEDPNSTIWSCTLFHGDDLLDEFEAELGGC
jgi:hypothetical protein